MVGIGDRVLPGASSAVRFGRERVRAVRERAGTLRSVWRRRRFYATHPSRAADPDIRARENAFFRLAVAVISDNERIETSIEYAERADTAQGRRDARGDAVAARHEAKRAFPLLAGALESEIAGTSSAEVVAAARELVECIGQYLRGNTVSAYLHPADALADLHSELYDQSASARRREGSGPRVRTDRAGAVNDESAD